MKIYAVYKNKVWEYEVQHIENNEKYGIRYYFNDDEIVGSSELDVYLREGNIVFSLDRERAIKIYKENKNEDL